MTDKEFKRSKYAGMPGSVAAIRVDYTRRLTAFDPPPADSHLAEVKRDVRRWKLGHRLGDKVDWNGSAPDESDRLFPKRPLMHQLSEFQAIKINYNYRAATLPSIHKDTLYVAKPSKLEVDRRIFLTPQEKQKLVDRCPATVTKLSLFEIQNDPKQLPSAEKEQGWNASTALSHERASLFCSAEAKRQASGAAAFAPRAATVGGAGLAGNSRTGGGTPGATSLAGEGGQQAPELDTFVAINKTKGILNHNTYISPRQRVDQQMEAIRAEKIAARLFEERQQQRYGGGGKSKSAGGTPQTSEDGSTAPPRVYKMSNIDEWLAVPKEVEHLRTMLGNSQQAVMAAQAAAASAGQARGGVAGGGGVDVAHSASDALAAVPSMAGGRHREA